MENVLIILIVTAGFATISFLYYRHVREMVILIKANTLGEAKYFTEKTERAIMEDDKTLSELIESKTPDDIRGMFYKDVENHKNQAQAESE